MSTKKVSTEALRLQRLGCRYPFQIGTNVDLPLQEIISNPPQGSVDLTKEREMKKNQLITLCFLFITTITFSTVQASGNYVLSTTNGRKDVGYSKITDTGTQITSSNLISFTSTGNIGTTSPYLLGSNMQIHHTFFNGTKVVYGVAVFDFATSQLAQLIPVLPFKLVRFDILKVFGTSAVTPTALNTTPARTLYTRTAKDTNSALLNASGIPAGGKKPIFVNPVSDALFGVSIAKDGDFAVQTLGRVQGGIQITEIQTKKVVSGGGSGAPIKFSVSGGFPYSPTISNALGTSAPGNAGKSAATFRWIAYRLIRNFGQSTEQSQVQLQQIDDTGNKVGNALPLGNFAAAPPFSVFPGQPEAYPSVVLAPDASFVVYTAYAASCKKEIMVAQRINPLTGVKIGPKKTLFGCNKLANIPIGFFGIDLIKLN